jgi:hypothetical protein
MTGYLVFTEWEPLIVVASKSMVREGRLANELRDRGIDKFIAHEVPVERLRENYGVPFEVIETDLRDGKRIRFLDSNGSHVFDTVRFTELGRTIFHEH